MKLFEPITNKDLNLKIKTANHKFINFPQMLISTITQIAFEIQEEDENRNASDEILIIEYLFMNNM